MVCRTQFEPGMDIRAFEEGSTAKYRKFRVYCPNGTAHSILMAFSPAGCTDPFSKVQIQQQEQNAENYAVTEEAYDFEAYVLVFPGGLMDYEGGKGEPHVKIREKIKALYPDCFDYPVPVKMYRPS